MGLKWNKYLNKLLSKACSWTAQICLKISVKKGRKLQLFILPHFLNFYAAHCTDTVILGDLQLKSFKVLEKNS